MVVSNLNKIETRIFFAIVVCILSVFISYMVENHIAEHMNDSVLFIWFLMNAIPFSFALMAGNGHEPDMMIFGFIIALQWFIITLIILSLINTIQQIRQKKKLKKALK